MDLEAAEPFSCPRCESVVTERFYGPCARCRSELAATQATVTREVQAERFEPTMHVTPNGGDQGIGPSPRG